MSGPIMYTGSGGRRRDPERPLGESCGAGGSQEHHVLFGLDVVALSQFQDGLAVQGRDGGLYASVNRTVES